MNLKDLFWYLTFPVRIVIVLIRVALITEDDYPQLPMSSIATTDDPPQGEVSPNMTKDDSP